MSIHSVVEFTSQTPPAGLLASNARRESATQEAPAVPGLAPRDTIRIGLAHMDVVLSISAEPRSGAAEVDFTMPATEGMLADPVMERLLRELGQTEARDGSGDIHGDAIRLALAARWLRLRSQPAPGPRHPSDGALQKWRLKRVIAYVDEHIGETISLADLANASGLSRMYFATRFRAATGLRPHEYVLRRRVASAKDMLVRTNESLVEIAFNVGFQTQAHFTTVFKRFAGISPGRWRSSNRQFA